MSSLPIPSAAAQQHSQALATLIANTIQKAGGWISFADFMHLALYAPSLGYYSAGSQKFGDAQKGGGDFVTAPQISPLFAQTLSRQIAQVLQELALKNLQGNILELGAGTGKLACDTLLTLAQLNQLPTQYFILEVSDHLRQVQLEYLEKNLPTDLFQRVVWLQSLPENFSGVIVANEVLDALPVHIVHNTPEGLCERGITLSDEVKAENAEKLNGFAVSSEKLNGFSQTHFSFQDVLIPSQKTTMQHYLLEAATENKLPHHYITEFCPAANGLIASLANALQHGAMILIDYGFSAREYYHPQRNQGTLMCHYQQLAHTNPLTHIGLQDITAHVDFTAIAHAGVNSGLELSGFCSQAQFLMNCGILDVMAEISPDDYARYAPMAAAAQKLLSPAEMGDLFKVIGFTKGLEAELIGFMQGDKSHTL